MSTRRHYDYIQSVGDAHRKKYGQFFTHKKVADFMVGWVLRSSERGLLFDPAFGLGAFHDSIKKNQRVSFHGYEADPHILDYWRKNSNSHINVELKNYLTSWGNKYDNIVCNPPYARFQHFDNRNDILRAFAEKMNMSMSGYTNIASAFLVKSIHELKKNGRLAYLMPLEFLNTGYGKAIKEKLIEKGHLHSIIKLDCEKDIFPDATTTVGIILYDSSKHHTHVNFHNISSINNLHDVHDSEPESCIDVRIINAIDKWMPYFTNDRVSINHEKAVPLEHYGRFSRGIATGANEFFAIKPSQAAKLGIENASIPCITKSSQINNPVFDERQYSELVKADSRVLLFTPNGDLSNSDLEYIREGERRLFNERYITKCRNPWYKVEQRNPSPILLNVFSRSGYKIILNKSNAVTLTCYHGFQPNLFGRRYVGKLFLYMASNAGRKILSLSKRVYGKSLDKFEPNDLNRAFAPASDVMDMISDRDAEQALCFMEKNDRIPDSIEDHFMEMAL